jgi:hypothetical protein
LPAVAWTYKFRISTSPIAARILRALAVQLHENQTALLSVEHISGIFNNMGDVASQQLVYWDDIKDNLPPNLKISPIAAILHKSQKFRMILDLSFKLLLNGKRLESVNEASDKASAPQHAMFELGNVIPRIIWAMALSRDKTTPFMF